VSDIYDCVVVAGRRSCPGEQLARQELTLFVVALLQSFYFKPPEGQDTVEVHDDRAVSLPSSHDSQTRRIDRLDFLRTLQRGTTRIRPPPSAAALREAIDQYLPPAEPTAASFLL